MKKILYKILQTGSYEFEWNGGSNSCGVFYYTLQSENFKETKRMVLVK
ncbi:MAG TPA: hypothetical protein PLG90_03275 [Ignavibacteria bacterium]|nr:hypothetical protein [Ignavibacteria bacterium]